MQVHALMHIRMCIRRHRGGMRRTDTSGEGKEQFHAERVVGPQNRAELQLGSRSLRHVVTEEPASRFNFSDTFRQAVVELSRGTTLSFEPGSEIYTCSWPFASLARLVPLLLQSMWNSWNLNVLNALRAWNIAVRTTDLDRPGIGPIQAVSAIIVVGLLRESQWTRKMCVIRKISIF